MTISLVGVFADARALWRSERQLLVPVAAVFFFLPMLGIVLLLAGSAFPASATPEEMRAAVAAFYSANLLWVLLANLAIHFGSFALFNLFLQGGGRTLGEVLRLTLRRFLPLLAIDLLAGLLFGIGMSLFVLPGLFLFARTWLAAPAFAAVPEKGPADAYRQAWRRSRGFDWIVMLGAAALVLLAAMLAIVVATGVLAALGGLAGAGALAEVLGYVVAATIGGWAWTMLALLRISLYRLTAPSSGT